MDPKAIEGNHFGEHKIQKYHPTDYSVFNHGFVLHILELRASRLNNCTIGSTIFTFIHIALSTKYFFPFSIKRILIKYSIVYNLAFLLHFPVDRSGNLDLSRFCSLSIRIL